MPDPSSESKQDEPQIPKSIQFGRSPKAEKPDTKGWDPDKPPGGKLPPEAKPSAQDRPAKS